MSYLIEEYTSLANYHGRPTKSNPASLKATKLDLINSAIMVGLGQGKKYYPTQEFLRWRIRTILTFIDIDKSTRYFTYKNTKALEKTEKANISFFVGMIFAHLYMVKNKKVRYLQHLDSHNITYKIKKNKKNVPDLFGVSPDGKTGYLVEAKGSINYISKNVIDKANAQLKAIDSVEYISNGSKKIYSDAKNNMARLISATGSNSKKQLKQVIIDPIGEQSRILTVSKDIMVYNYYINLIQLLKDSKNEEIILENENAQQAFITIPIPSLNISIGVLKNIYEMFTNASYNQPQFISEKIDSILRNVNPVSKEHISLQSNGILVLDNENNQRYLTF